MITRNYNPNNTQKIVNYHENNGRKMMQQILDLKGIKGWGTEGQYNHSDYNFRYGDDKYLHTVEIKDRDASAMHFDSVMVQTSKLIHLIEKIKNGEVNTASYCFFYGGVRAYIYDVRTLVKWIKEGKIKETQKYTPRCTANLSKGYKYYGIYEVPKEWANSTYTRDNINSTWTK